MIYPCPPPLDAESIARAKRLSVSLLLDGAKAAGISLAQGGCLSAEIAPANRAYRMVGTALTARTQPGDNQPIHLAIYSAAQAGYVLVVDGRAHESCAYMGDLMMGACKALGFAGLVIDGYARDWDGVMKLDFPVFCRGFMPLAPTKVQEGDVNGPITCGGAAVEPGDLVMGDCDGVCVIPRAHVVAVLDAAEKRQAYERAREEAIAAYVQAKESGNPLPDLAPAWAREKLNAAAEALRLDKSH